MFAPQWDNMLVAQVVGGRNSNTQFDLFCEDEKRELFNSIIICTSGFATTHVVVPGHYNDKFCFENILSFICK